MKQYGYYLTLLFLILPQTFFGDKKESIKEVFNGYKKAILAKDGKKAVSYLSKETIDYYAHALDLTLNADKAKLEKESMMTRLNVLISRYAIDKATLKKLDARGFLVIAVDKGLIGEKSVQRMEIGDITLDGETKATSKITANGRVSPFDYLYRKESEGWKLDLTHTLEKIEPVFTMLAANSGKSENEFLIAILEKRYNTTISEDIWKPVNG